MLLQKISVAMGLFALASANVVVKRQGNSTVPDACTSLCTSYTGVISATTPQELEPFCTSDTEQSLIPCFGCIDTEVPGEITPESLVAAQSAIQSLMGGCAAIGSPIPTITPPEVTGTTTINTAPPTDLSSLSLTNGGPTAAPITSGTGSAGAPAPSTTTTSHSSAPAQSTTTTSHSGAMILLPQTFGVAGLVVALIAMIVV